MVAHYGYAALLAAAVVEGPIATVVGAFLASQGLLDVALVYAVVVVGDLVGDLLCYAIGHSGHAALRARPTEASERRRRQVEALSRRFRVHAGRMLLFGKLTHSAGFLVLLAAGATRVPMTAFFAYNLIGTLAKSALFVAIGYFSGAAYNRIDSYLGAASLLIFLTICLGTGIWLRKHLSTPERSNG